MSLLRRLWDLLVQEMEATGLVSQDREEALMNFALTPYYVERVLLFGAAVCLDSFLYLLAILPLRIILALGCFLSRGNVPASRKGDIVKGLIAVLTLWGLMNLNTSKVYHSIRGQAGIKLFVIYNILEVADKFCCAIGQDILDSLVSLPTALSLPRTLVFGLFTLAHCAIHSFVLVWELVTLNVAVNSYSNALLTLVLSSHFGEIKSAVFKKFDRETLFQLTCADITQRFQLFLMLIIVALRNALELSAGQGAISVPSLLGPVAMVLISTISVDWLKHAYIAKFNNLRPKHVYSRFLTIFVGDYVEHRQLSSHHLMMKRTGLPVLPLAIVCLRMLMRLSFATPLNFLILWAVLLVAKLILGLVLIDYTNAILAEAAAEKVEHKKSNDKEDLERVTLYSFPNKAWQN